jgi:hypothetical protein
MYIYIYMYMCTYIYIYIHIYIYIYTHTLVTSASRATEHGQNEQMSQVAATELCVLDNVCGCSLMFQRFVWDHHCGGTLGGIPCCLLALAPAGFKMCTYWKRLTISFFGCFCKTVVVAAVGLVYEADYNTSKMWVGGRGVGCLSSIEDGLNKFICAIRPRYAPLLHVYMDDACSVDIAAPMFAVFGGAIWFHPDSQHIYSLIVICAPNLGVISRCCNKTNATRCFGIHTILYCAKKKNTKMAHACLLPGQRW